MIRQESINFLINFLFEILLRLRLIFYRFHWHLLFKFEKCSVQCAPFAGNLMWKNNTFCQDTQFKKHCHQFSARISAFCTPILCSPLNTLKRGGILISQPIDDLAIGRQFLSFSLGLPFWTLLLKFI